MTLKTAHTIWKKDRKLARKIGLEAIKIIEQAYLSKPWGFGCRHKKPVLASLFYLLGIRHGKNGGYKTQWATANIGCTETTVRTLILEVWLKEWPELFPEFTIAKTGVWNDALLYNGRRPDRLFGNYTGSRPRGRK